MDNLIPEIWFDDLPQWLLLLIGAVAVFFIIKGADWLVEGASGMALRLGISKVIIGATIVSLGTTTPECAVSVMAAWEGKAGLALGNAVGSIIADTGLIFGTCCMLMVLPVDRFILNRQGWVQYGAATLLAIICYSVWALQGPAASLGRWVGVLMLMLLVWYMWASIRWGRQRSAMDHDATDETDEVVEKAAGAKWHKLAGMFLLGLVLVVLFGRVLICCVVELAERWGVPEVVIASTIVAFGTSLPELVVGITAVRKGHPELLIGNVIGADVLNVLFVIGASAVAADLPIVEAGAKLPEIFLFLHLPAMLIILTLFRLYIRAAIKRGRFLRWFGAPLVALYLAYLAFNYALST